MKKQYLMITLALLSITHSEANHTLSSDVCVNGNHANTASVQPVSSQAIPDFSFHQSNFDNALQQAVKKALFSADLSQYDIHSNNMLGFLVSLNGLNSANNNVDQYNVFVDYNTLTSQRLVDANTFNVHRNSHGYIEMSAKTLTYELNKSHYSQTTFDMLTNAFIRESADNIGKQTDYAQAISFLKDYSENMIHAASQGKEINVDINTINLINNIFHNKLDEDAKSAINQMRALHNAINLNDDFNNSFAKESLNDKQDHAIAMVAEWLNDMARETDDETAMAAEWLNNMARETDDETAMAAEWLSNMVNDADYYSTSNGSSSDSDDESSSLSSIESISNMSPFRQELLAEIQRRAQQNMDIQLYSNDSEVASVSSSTSSVDSSDNVTSDANSQSYSSSHVEQILVDVQDTESEAAYTDDKQYNVAASAAGAESIYEMDQKLEEAKKQKQEDARSSIYDKILQRNQALNNDSDTESAA